MRHQETRQQLPVSDPRRQLPSQPSILQYVIREFPDPSQLITQGPTSDCFNLCTRESILSSHCKCTSFPIPGYTTLKTTVNCTTALGRGKTQQQLPVSEFYSAGQHMAALVHMVSTAH